MKKRQVTAFHTSVFAVWLLALAAYLPGLSGGFILDDYSNLVLDPDWKVTNGMAEEWINAATQGFAGPLGRPLALLTFASNYFFTGLNPFFFKATNVAIHLLNGALLYFLIRQIASSESHRIRGARLFALLVSAVWLLHPLQVSTVLYVVQRMELGAATGVLICMLGYIQGRSRQLQGASGTTGFVISASGLLIGLGFKESALLSPGFTLLLEIFLFRFKSADGATSRFWLLFYSIGALGAASTYFMLSEQYVTPEAYATRSFNAIERVMTQPRVLLLYMKLMLWPAPDGMLFYYDNYPISTSTTQPISTLWSGALIGVLAICALLFAKRLPTVGLGLAWFLMAHALTSNVVPLELAFEHRNYLALAGVVLAVAQPVSAGFANVSRSTRLTAASLLVVGLSLITATQAATWGDPLRLAWTLENRNPTSPRANYDLGRELMLRAEGDQSSPSWALAERLFERGINLPDASPLAAQGLLIMRGQTGREIDPKVWRQFRSALNRRPVGPEGIGALHAVAECRIMNRCAFDDQELLMTYVQTLSSNPKSVSLHIQYAQVAQAVVGDEALADDMMQIAEDLDPANLNTRLARIALLASASDPTANARASRLLSTFKREVSSARFDAQVRIIEAVLERRAEHGSFKEWGP